MSVPASPDTEPRPGIAAEHAEPGPDAANPFPPVVRVALPTPLRRLFDYRAIAGARPGVRVRVPFGSRSLVGVVIECAEHSEHEGSLRAVTECLDTEPLLGADDLALARWISAYYHGPIGETVLAMLPATLRRGESVRDLRPRRWYARGNAEALVRAPAQAALWQQLAERADGLPDDAISGAADRRALRALRDRGLAEEIVGAPPDPAHRPRASLALNPEQAGARDAVLAQADRFACFLLEGITGSGKTEVYLQILERVVARGRQALVLVPEIGLTPQTVARFRDRFGQVAVSHSGLTDVQRDAAWQEAAGGAPILIGTRSAVFAPLPRLGVVIVDEEHDGSYKQQDGVRYSARDVAITRARNAGIPVVLGSATPSFDALANVERGRFRSLRLTRRAGGALVPDFAILDIRGQALEGGLDRRTGAAIRRHLDAGGQVLVYLNRRGYAPSLSCDRCAWTARCSACDVHLVVHRHPAHLACHHCGRSAPIERTCPDCGGATRAAGIGTQRTESTLAARFPDVPVLRMDRDSVRGQTALESRLARMQSGEPAILLGTQMIAKGHHFPGVTLVVILGADTGLFSADFRAPERCAQAIIQVAGRAGRADRGGEVILQSTNPDHPVVQTLARNGYRAFADVALEERRAAGLPPWAHAALIRADAPDPDQARQVLERLAPVPVDRSVQRLGPVAAPLERIDGRWRAQLMLLARARPPLHDAIRGMVAALEADREARRIRWSVDVDPADYG